MKKILLIFSIVLIASCDSGKRTALIGETPYQQKQNEIFKDGSKSPLKEKDLRNFKRLTFFPVDTSFVVTAKLTRTENTPSFKMATNTERVEIYKEYGLLNFKLKGKDYKLAIYQSQENLDNDKFKEDLYLPFTDTTSGNESYGAGRYMDVKITDINLDNTIELNFNNTYNPYCAYNERFSCPLTPRKNHLDLEIKAGIMDFKKH